MQKSTREPLWKRLAIQIRQDIASGQLTPGAQLPTEVQMSERFSVSRFTIRQALADLERQGLIRIEHGRGLFVAEQAIPFILDSKTRFSENLRRLELQGHRQFLECYIEEAGEEVSEQLAIGRHDEVVVIKGLAIIEGRPAGLVHDCFPAQRFPGIDALLKLNPSPTAALRAFGLEDYTRHSTRICSRMPTAAEAALLEIARTNPLIETRKTDVSPNGEPITFGIGSFRADRVQFIIG